MMCLRLGGRRVAMRALDAVPTLGTVATTWNAVSPSPHRQRDIAPNTTVETAAPAEEECRDIQPAQPSPPLPLWLKFPAEELGVTCHERCIWR